LPFSGRYADADPVFTPDGARVYFISQRPVGEGEPPRDDWDLWLVDRTEDGWGEPVWLGLPVNSEAIDVYPSVAADGTLYFSSGREGGRGRNDLYRTRFENGAWTEPENLPGAINSEFSEGDLTVAPDQSWIVFASSGRPDSRGQGDLYVSFRGPDGTWGEPRNLGDRVNSRWTEYCPSLTPDGRFLFFTSYRVEREDPSTEPLTYAEIARLYDSPQSGQGDVYWIAFSLADEPEGPR
jgi:Tol biopolymer transport system component